MQFTTYLHKVKRGKKFSVLMTGFFCDRRVDGQVSVATGGMMGRGMGMGLRSTLIM